MLKLIVGLANPGKIYNATRHNAGEWFIHLLAQELQASFSPESKLKSHIAQGFYENQPIRLAVPTTFMNESGSAVLAMMNFFKIKPEEMLVVHDEIDLPPGTARLKFDGGAGGHNGLRDIMQRIGCHNFYRLRIGVGHPGRASQVTNYVLKKPTTSEKKLIEAAMGDALYVMPDIMRGEFEKAMTTLHSQTP